MQHEVVQQRIFVGHIVVVPRKNTSRIIALQSHEVRNFVAVEVQDIVYCVALLHEELGTVEVAEERL